MPTDLSIAVPSSHVADGDQSIAGSSPLVPVNQYKSPFSEHDRGIRPKPRKKRRVAPPKDSKIYKTAVACIALRAQGLRGQAVSEALGIKYETMRAYLHRAVSKGWLNESSFTDPEDKVDYALIHKAVRNAGELLDERDKEMTIETLKGTGVFKQHQAVKVDNTATVGLALKVQVELPTFSGTLPTVRVGSTGGAHGASIPVDAEVMETGEGNEQVP